MLAHQTMRARIKPVERNTLWHKKWAVSDDQRPDLAGEDHQATTTAHSGQFRIDLLFARLASLKATPSCTVAPGLGVPS